MNFGNVNNSLRLRAFANASPTGFDKHSNVGGACGEYAILVFVPILSLIAERVEYAWIQAGDAAFSLQVLWLHRRTLRSAQGYLTLGYLTHDCASYSTKCQTYWISPLRSVPLQTDAVACHSSHVTYLRACLVTSAFFLVLLVHTDTRPFSMDQMAKARLLLISRVKPCTEVEPPALDYLVSASYKIGCRARC